jgi:hypothetical protein
MQEIDSRSNELDELPLQRDYHGRDQDIGNVCDGLFFATLTFSPIKNAEVWFLFAVSF